MHPMTSPLTILFLSSSYKGDAMLQTAKALGCTVMLLMEDSLRTEPWPFDVIDHVQYVPNLGRYQDVINTVSWMCRGMQIDMILPLDEFEVELVAQLREHLRLPGTGVTHTRHFRDKLIMRDLARAAALPIPEYIQVKNYDRLREWMQRVPMPWLLKPRTEAGSMGIRKPNSPEDVWRALDELGDRQSYYLLEQFVPGDVYHVDSISVDGEIIFTTAQKYGAPPIQVYQGGGVFMSRILPRDSEESIQLRALNARVLDALGMENGVTHAEYIRGHADGQYYFLEVAARVGGAFIADMIEHATGINLWREWARLEVARFRGEQYDLPPTRENYGGVLVTLARQEHPDLGRYSDPEVVWRADKPYHAALIAVSPDPAHLQNLLFSYAERFAVDFTTTADPKDAQRTGISG
jgi:hypothetical protein